MHKRTIRVIALTILIIAALFARFFWHAHTDHRSTPGRIVRFFKGESGAEQQLNDLAEDIRNRPSLATLQSWAVETLEEDQEGKLHDTGGPPSFPPDGRPTLKLATKDRPDFIKHQWGVTNEFGEEEPELLILFGTNRQPECVAIAWYDHGIQIGRTNYQMPYPSSDVGLYVKAEPGIYIYNNYK